MEASSAMIAAIIVFILVTIFNVLQDLIVAKRLREMHSETVVGLRNIHELVNSQLTEAVERMREAMRVAKVTRELLAHLAPNDPRVRTLFDDELVQQADAPTEIPTTSAPFPPFPEQPS